MTFDRIEGDKLPRDHPMHNTNASWAPRDAPDHTDRMPGVAGSNYVSNSPRGLTKSNSPAMKAGNHQRGMNGSTDQHFSASPFKGDLNGYQDIDLAGAGRPHHVVELVKSKTLTPSASFTRLRSPESPTGHPPGTTRASFTKEDALRWLRKPLNLLLLAWLIPTVVATVIWLMISFGILNSAIKNKRERDDIKEICSQIQNALFVLGALCLQPVQILHLFWLARWTGDDVARLRDVYCKGGLKKPHERLHILVVLLLLHLSYVTTYAMAALCWAYKRSERPERWVNVMFWLTLGSGVAARVYYRRLSPLRRDDDVVHDGQQGSGVAV